MSRQFPKRMQEPKSDTGLSDSQLISGVNKFDIQVVEPITDDPMKREGGVRFFSARIKSIQPIRGFNQQFTLGLLLPQQDKKLIGSAVPIDDGVHNSQPQSGSRVLGGEEGFHILLRQVRLKARPAVLNLQPAILL